MRFMHKITATLLSTMFSITCIAFSVPAETSNLISGSDEVNLALNKPATSTGYYSAEGVESKFIEAHVNDGDIQTLWASDAETSSPWIQIDLGEPTKIGRVEIVARQDTGGSDTTQDHRADFEVRASNDEIFSTYKLIAGKDGSPFEFKGTWVANSSTEQLFRYVRVFRTNQKGHFTIAELRIFAEKTVIPVRDLENPPIGAQMLISKLSGKALTINDLSAVIAESYDFKNRQRWLFENVDNRVQIRNANINKYLSCTLSGLTMSDSPEQWEIMDAEDAGFQYIKHSVSGNYLKINNDGSLIASPSSPTDQLVTEDVQSDVERDVALGKLATSPFSLTEAYQPSWATDGNISTFWASQDILDEPYIQIDLGNAFSINRVEIMARQDADSTTHRANFKIVASNAEDFSDSIVIATKDAIPFDAYGIWVASVSKSIEKYRYVRMQRIDPYGHFTVAEIKVFSTDPVAHVTDSTTAFKWDICKAYIENVPNSEANWLTKGLGVMNHIIVNESTVNNDINVNEIVAQLKEVNAKYFIVPIGQNSGYYIGPNSRIASYVTLNPNGRSSSRDIIMEFADALHEEGIKLIVYTTAQPAIRCGTDPQDFGLTELDSFGSGRFNMDIVMKWTQVLREWSIHYGDKIDGWWVDGAYLAYGMTYTLGSVYANALKSGNANAIIALNNGIGVAPYVTTADYTSGEVNNPVDDADPNNQASWVLPETPTFNGYVQWFTLTYIGTWWLNDTMRYTPQLWADYSKAVLEAGGAICLDVAINAQNGYVLTQNAMNVLCQVKASLEVTPTPEPSPTLAPTPTHKPKPSHKPKHKLKLTAISIIN